MESIQASGKRKTQEPFLYKLWHTFYETLCQKVQNFTIKQGKTAQNKAVFTYGGTGASQIELLIGETMCFVVEILYLKAI